MLREAELFVMAEDMSVEVLGRIRDADLGIELPPLFAAPGFDRAAPLRSVLEQVAQDELVAAAVLSGAAVADPDRAALERELGDARRPATLVHLAHAATTAASKVVEAAAPVRAPYGETSTGEYLLRLTVCRSLVAHYVAAYLGSTACPLPEELARPLWELTEPGAEAWRELGIFREPLFPIPDKASWRDIFLRTAGHEPHPLGH